MIHVNNRCKLSTPLTEKQGFTIRRSYHGPSINIYDLQTTYLTDLVDRESQL